MTFRVLGLGTTGARIGLGFEPTNGVHLRKVRIPRRCLGQGHERPSAVRGEKQTPRHGGVFVEGGASEVAPFRYWQNLVTGTGSLSALPSQKMSFWSMPRLVR